MIEFLKNYKLLFICIPLVGFMTFQHIQLVDKRLEIEKVTNERDAVSSQIQSLKYESDQNKKRIEDLNNRAHSDAIKAYQDAEKILNESVSDVCQDSINWAKQQAIIGI